MRALRRPHVDEVVLDEEILALDQLDAHLLGQEGMLEVGAVVHAGCEHDDDRIVDRGRRHGAQRLEQQVGVMRDRSDAVPAEQLGEEPHHHLAVLEHVADAARHPQVVFQHVVAAAAVRVGGPDDVDAGDVRVDAARHVDALHLGTVLGVVHHLLERHQAGLQDRLLVVDVVDEAVERGDALAQAALHLSPFVGRDDARNQVEGDQALGAVAVLVLRAVDREGDADAAEDDFRFLAAGAHHLGRLLREPVVVATVMFADGVAALPHLVEADSHSRASVPGG